VLRECGQTSGGAVIVVEGMGQTSFSADAGQPSMLRMAMEAQSARTVLFTASPRYIEP
jgi:hypothetical protein